MLIAGFRFKICECVPMCVCVCQEGCQITLLIGQCDRHQKEPWEGKRRRRAAQLSITASHQYSSARKVSPGPTHANACTDTQPFKAHMY